MYNTKVVCTYHMPDVFTEEENNLLTEQEKCFIRNAIYRQEFLNIFNIEEFNEKKINIVIQKLYLKIKNSNDLRECIDKLSGYIQCTDEAIGLTMMFSYDLMYITHKCISEYLEIGTISSEYISQLKINI